MNFDVLISIGIGVAVYLVALGIFVLVKWLINKHKFDKDVNSEVNDENEKDTH